ncbi:TolC family protein [Tautonia plasticadhaerens]|uniref:Cobalt-zinc-cadmium resistance protein CzcC n=1 Tax=Tautonia plasticadhaerens TaxID=2527974 RepID=A0A518GW80_9BACT|nr:TolC family protein [Tautonia plasticadhaerens]QDV32860.1 Cobalt-zinc-cadmium resistance protein CzcC precursor [Tautonia plasticadhaerens]
MRTAITLLGIILAAWAVPAVGQGPQIDSVQPPPIGGERSRLGLAPGQPGRPQPTPGEAGFPVSGRPGPSVPRVPSTVSVPGLGYPTRLEQGIASPEQLPTAISPPSGALGLPGSEDGGSPGGLTLDAAIERLVAANLDLLASYYELPQADADTLTAGLRANPIFYADTQLVPYGGYSADRPGGPTQYDVNVSLPLDLSGKRRSRVRVARLARSVLEAQFQDAVRLQIDNLYTVFVDALASREAVRFSRAGLEGLERTAALTRDLVDRGESTVAELDRVLIQLAAARVALEDAEEQKYQSLRTLAVLLNIPPGEASTLEVRGGLRVDAPEPGPIEGLIRLALEARPDLLAYRLGIDRARADVDLARANAFSDIYVLYQPYTFQDNSAFDRRSATSWALGVTAAVPVFNRNQGNVRRAQLNVTQTRVELASLQRQIIAEIEQAEREFRVSGRTVARLQVEVMSDARRVLDDAQRLFAGGEIDAIAFLAIRREYNDVLRQYRDQLVRRRRSLLDLNTAVGRRILP